VLPGCVRPKADLLQEVPQFVIEMVRPLLRGLPSGFTIMAAEGEAAVAKATTMIATKMRINRRLFLEMCTTE
jgi:hypothetical protein